MGIVKRQTIKNNILSYLGVVIGVFSQLYIYPLNLELKGFTDGIIRFATLFFPFFTLGVGGVMLRFLPYLSGGRDAAAARLLARGLLVVTGSMTLLVLAYALAGDPLIAFFSERGYKMGPLQTHGWSIILILGCLVYASILTTNLINYNRIAIPVLFNNLVLKVALPLLIALTTFAYLTKEQFLIGILATYLLIVIGLLVYSVAIGASGVSMAPLDMEEKSVVDMFSVATYATAGLIGSSVITNMDVVMINTQLSDLETAIYTFGLFMAGIMMIPYSAVNTITAPIVAEKWKTQDIDHLSDLYRDSSIALTAAGTLVFTGICVCLPYLYFITEDMQQHLPGYWPTVLIAVGILLGQISSVNGTLIGFTDHYRWQILFVLFAGLLNYCCNLYFIVTLNYGIWGAALATMISLIIYDLSKSVFIYWKIGIQPLRMDHLRILLLHLFAGALAWSIPALGNVWLELLVRGTVIVAVVLSVLWFTNLVPLLRRTLREGLKWVA